MKTVFSIQASGVVAAPARSLLVIVDRSSRRIALSLIVRIEARGSHCQLLTCDGRWCRLAGSLATIARSTPGFWRIHRSHLINPAYLSGSLGLVRHQNHVRMLTCEVVPVARRRKEAIYQQLKQLAL